MFVQIIQGRVADKAAARETMDRWLVDLEPGAVGWLGGTFGFTEDGMLVAVVRFESKEAAEANNARPEQAAWWEEMSRHFTGDITFHDCADVSMLVKGGSDDAGFVQIIQGRVKDRDRAHALVDSSSRLIAKERPDVIGATLAIDEAGYLTETVAFTSESEARNAEKKTMTAELQQMAEEEMALLEDTRYLDLHEPWFASARQKR
jgi:hypothetical protein